MFVENLLIYKPNKNGHFVRNNISYKCSCSATTDPSEIWISDMTVIFHMMNFVFTKRNFFAAIDIFCVDLFMQSHTILLLESDAVILHLGKREKIV